MMQYKSMKICDHERGKLSEFGRKFGGLVNKKLKIRD